MIAAGGAEGHFEDRIPESPPGWRRSGWVLLLIALALPPVGVILVWARPGMGVFRKLAATLALALLSVVHLRLFFGLRVELDGGTRPIFYFKSVQSHYAELEQHRSAQKAVAPAEAASPLPAPPVTEESLNPPAVSPALDVKKTEGSEPNEGRRYWIRFRGPRMDGHYEQTEISTRWPAEGLPLLWKQPVGGGYASFVIADGRAFTIEQRREKEVVAAYELTTGREIWRHSWTAEFRETLGGDGPRATPPTKWQPFGSPLNFSRLKARPDRSARPHKGALPELERRPASREKVK
jgi:uncharacterized membrane protein YqaE (UPF0057 family)